MMNIDMVEKIKEALEMINSESSAYYNKESGEIVWVFEYMDNDTELLDDIEYNPDKYISLPTQYDIDEYSIMSEFAYSCDNTEIVDELCLCLKGSGAFRRFKDKICYLGVREAWFEFRDNAYRKIAEKWCADNKLIVINNL